MKNIAIIIAFLFVGASASAQHPLSKKGPKAKNYKASKDSNRKATKLSLFAAPSNKYASGANAKNTPINLESSEQLSVYPNQGLKRATGANAKNRMAVKQRSKLTADINDTIEVKKEEVPMKTPKPEMQK